MRGLIKWLRLGRSPDAEKAFDEAFYQATVGADPRKLSAMSDLELADWQSHQEKGSAPAILAEREWQNRLISRQVSAIRFAAWLALVGVIVGWLLASCDPLTFLRVEAPALQSPLGKPPASRSHGEGQS